MKKLFIETYGCQMNVADSEVVASVMQMAGYETCEDIDEADAVFLNTCSVRENAENKIYHRLEALYNINKNKHRKVILGVLGCMAERVKDDLIEHHHANLVAGPDSYLTLPDLIAQCELGQNAIDTTLSLTETYRDVLPKRAHGMHISGFVSIMRGCNNFCHYCIVPYTRGRERSRDVESIIREAKDLAEKGYKEVTLLGQNVNSYGKNLENPITFARLLEKIEQIEGLERIRFMTSHPKDLSDELIEVMGRSKKICKHLHLPVQSGSSRILKKMNRHYTKEQYVALAKKIQERIPGVSFTTDIIVGFPGETEEDFKETLDVVREVGFDSAYTYVYSKRSGTPAASMEDQVDKDVIKDRFDRLLALLKETSAKNCKKKVGDIERVLIEEENTHEEGMLTGRLENNLLVHFKGCKEQIGTMADVKLVEEKGFYYMGEQIHG